MDRDMVSPAVHDLDAKYYTRAIVPDDEFPFPETSALAASPRDLPWEEKPRLGRVSQRRRISFKSLYPRRCSETSRWRADDFVGNRLGRLKNGPCTCLRGEQRRLLGTDDGLIQPPSLTESHIEMMTSHPSSAEDSYPIMTSCFVHHIYTPGFGTEFIVADTTKVISAQIGKKGPKA